MNLDQQVVSLELAKELKKAGYKQEGIFWWAESFSKKSKLLLFKIGSEYYKVNGGGSIDFTFFIRNSWSFYVAPTVAELGERLPQRLEFNGMKKIRVKKEPLYEKCIASLCFEWKPVGWCASYIGLGESPIIANTEANARAKMWLYLKKEGWLK